VHGKLGNQFGNMLRGEKLAARFSGIGGVVGDEEFIGIAEQVDLVVCKIAKIKPLRKLRSARLRGCEVG